MSKFPTVTNDQIAAMRQNTTINTQRRNYWSKENKQKLKDLFHAGVGISAMALTFQRSELAIINQLCAMNLFKKHRAPKTKREQCLCSQCSLYPHCEKCTSFPMGNNFDKAE